MSLYRVEYICDYLDNKTWKFIPVKRKRYTMGYALGLTCYNLAHRKNANITDIYKIKISCDTLRKCWNNADELV